jgi:DNA polymerase V
MFALIDCNNFFVSCERLFRPDLADKPVVVLSNNDGCVISRSNEAKAIIPMQATLFSIQALVDRGIVQAFSSNPVLYRDLSRRVIETLHHFSPEVEQYSIDEAFLSLKGFAPDTLADYGQQIRQTVQQWTGIPVSVGIAPTKTLAKIAAHLAKHRPVGVCYLEGETDRQSALASLDVGEVWGIGRHLQAKLQAAGIKTALQLQQAEDRWIKKRLGVLGLRTVLELRGVVCFPIQHGSPQKKMRIVSRSFGYPVTALSDIKEAVATYTSRCAEKLRQDGLATGSLSVAIRTSRYDATAPYEAMHSATLEPPTNDTAVLLQTALKLAEAAFQPDYEYQKAKVIATDLMPADAIQGNWLARPVDGEKPAKLMAAMDRINQALHQDAIKFGALGLKQPWRMRSAYLSQRYTTHWQELPTVKLCSRPRNRQMSVVCNVS